MIFIYIIIVWFLYLLNANISLQKWYIVARLVLVVLKGSNLKKKAISSTICNLVVTNLTSNQKIAYFSKICMNTIVLKWSNFKNKANSSSVCTLCAMHIIVAERKNFKLLFSAGIILAVGVLNLYILSNENDWCHSTWVTSLGNIKGCVLLPRPLLFLTCKQQARPALMRRAHSLSLLPRPILAADRWTFQCERAHST